MLMIKTTKRFLMLGIATVMMQQAMAQAPTVVTDTRFARGATMAFGRIKSASPRWSHPPVSPPDISSIS